MYITFKYKEIKMKKKQALTYNAQLKVKMK